MSSRAVALRARSKINRAAQPIERQITKTHYVQRSSPHPLAGGGIGMTAVVTVAPVLVNVLRHIAHQFQVWKDLVKLLKRGPRWPYGSLRQVASEPHPP